MKQMLLVVVLALLGAGIFETAKATYGSCTTPEPRCAGRCKSWWAGAVDYCLSIPDGRRADQCVIAAEYGYNRRMDTCQCIQTAHKETPYEKKNRRLADSLGRVRASPRAAPPV